MACLFLLHITHCDMDSSDNIYNTQSLKISSKKKVLPSVMMKVGIRRINPERKKTVRKLIDWK